MKMVTWPTDLPSLQSNADNQYRIWWTLFWTKWNGILTQIINVICWYCTMRTHKIMYITICRNGCYAWTRRGQVLWASICGMDKVMNYYKWSLGCDLYYNWWKGLSYPWIWPSPAPTSDYLRPPQITWTTQFTLGPISGYSDYPWSLTSVPPFGHLDQSDHSVSD